MAEMITRIAGMIAPAVFQAAKVNLFLDASAESAGITGVDATHARIMKKTLFLKRSAVEVFVNPFLPKRLTNAAQSEERSSNLKSIEAKKTTTSVRIVRQIRTKPRGSFLGLIIYFSSTRNKNQ